MGVTPQELSRQIGANIDALVGADILNKFNLVIEPRSRIQAEINGRAIRMFFDTGAKLSYVDPEITQNYLTLGTARDFYPGMGLFETQTYRVPIRLGTGEIDLTVGVLPDLLQLTLMMANTSGILGTGILSDFAIELNPHRRRLVLERYDRKTSGSFPGLPRVS